MRLPASTGESRKRAALIIDLIKHGEDPALEPPEAEFTRSASAFDSESCSAARAAISGFLIIAVNLAPASFTEPNENRLPITGPLECVRFSG